MKKESRMTYTLQLHYIGGWWCHQKKKSEGKEGLVGIMVQGMLQYCTGFPQLLEVWLLIAYSKTLSGTNHHQLHQCFPSIHTCASVRVPFDQKTGGKNMPN